MSRSSRLRKLRDHLLHVFSGNAGLAFFGLRDVRPEDADQQEAERRQERQREHGRDEEAKS